MDSRLSGDIGQRKLGGKFYMLNFFAHSLYTDSSGKHKIEMQSNIPYYVLAGNVKNSL